MDSLLSLHVGVKTDPIEYRYSFRWLFRLLSEEKISRVQLGTFFELYHLSDNYFIRLRHLADEFGIKIESVFTAHRELGGFFVDDVDWVDQAFRNYKRLIEVGSLLGARRVGSNPGAVLRDRIDYKAQGISCYMEHMKRLMHYARERNVEWLTIEPMSCSAEPPSFPDEIEQMASELNDYHRAYPDQTVPVGLCFDVSHGLVDVTDTVKWTSLELLEFALPYVVEVHLKNTDEKFHSTFGFSDPERLRGMVDIERVVSLLKTRSSKLPVNEITGYLELPGPKLGRDYSDMCLEQMLRDSLGYLKRVFR